MTVPKEDILYVIRMVAFFNPPLQELADDFEEFTADTSDAKRAVEHAISVGDDVFEACAKQSPRLADCIHDFIYQIACPHRSVIYKNLAREKAVKRVVFGAGPPL